MVTGDNKFGGEVMKILLSLKILVVIALLAGCGGGGTVLVIGPIEGPMKLVEYESAQYTIALEKISNPKIIWSVTPAIIGVIENRTAETVTFRVGGIDAEMSATLSVQVTSVDGVIETTSRDVVIEDRPDSWVRTIGGIDRDRATGVTADSNGNVYVTGYFMDTVDFDPGPHADPHTSEGGEDAFLSKFTSGGDYIWSKTWGGPGIESGNEVKVDADGNIVVAGWSMQDVDFDPGPDFLTHDWYGANDFFVSKFDPDGNLIWAKAWGGGGYDIIHGMATSSDSSIYLGIEYFGTADFDPGEGVYEHTAVGYADIALCKLDGDGNFQWAHSWGSALGDGSDGLVFDDEGNLYMTGDFSFTIDFDPGEGVDELTSNGERDVFLMKWNSNDEYQWTRSWGSSGDTVQSWDKGNGIDVDVDGNPVVTGMFTNTVDFDAGDGEFTLESIGMADIFACKYDPDGNFIWARSFGSPEYDIGIEIQVDTQGNVYTIGAFKGTADFDPGEGVSNFISNGNHDSCLAVYNAVGEYSGGMSWGGIGPDYAHNIFITGSDEILVVGNFQVKNNFGYDRDEEIRESNGGSDIFIRKIKLVF